MKTKILIGVALAFALILGYRFCRAAFQDDEKKVREVIEQMRVAGEQRDVNGVMRHFSGDYRDRDGNSKLVLDQMVRRFIGRVKELAVRIDDISVMITGDTAYVDMAITAEAKSGDGIFFLLGSADGPARPNLTFKKTGAGDWLVTKVDNVDAPELY